MSSANFIHLRQKMRFKISPKVGRLNRKSGKTDEFDAICWKFQNVFQKTENTIRFECIWIKTPSIFRRLRGKKWSLKYLPKLAIWFKNSFKENSSKYSETFGQMMYRKTVLYSPQVIATKIIFMLFYCHGPWSNRLHSCCGGVS